MYYPPVTIPPKFMFLFSNDDVNIVSCNFHWRHKKPGLNIISNLRHDSIHFLNIILAMVSYHGDEKCFQTTIVLRKWRFQYW